MKYLLCQSVNFRETEFSKTDRIIQELGGNKELSLKKKSGTNFEDREAWDELMK